MKINLNDYFCTILFILIMSFIFQVTALLKTLEMQDSAKLKAHIALFRCLVLGHTKYNGVQLVYCNPFLMKTLYGSHSLDIRQPGINNGAFVVSPDTVWYALVLLLFSASAVTDTGSKTFECALIRHWIVVCFNYFNYFHYMYYNFFNI
jgi:hypothetical protein